MKDGVPADATIKIQLTAGRAKNFGGRGEPAKLTGEQKAKLKTFLS
jgi:hypothetical protein